MFNVFFIWAIQRCQLLEIKCEWTANPDLLIELISWRSLMPSIWVLILSYNCASDKPVVAQQLHEMLTKISRLKYSMLWLWWTVFVLLFYLISSCNHCRWSSSSQISDRPQTGFEPAQNLSSDLVEWSCAVVIITTSRRHE